MDIAGIQFPRTVQEILHDYQQGILKSETSEQPGEHRTPGGTSGLSGDHQEVGRGERRNKQPG